MKKQIIAVKKQQGNIVQVKLNDQSILTIEEAIIMAKKGLIENINTGLNRKQNKQKAFRIHCTEGLTNITEGLTNIKD